MFDDASETRALTRAECLGLLASARIGRIAVSTRALPLILPVMFVLDGEQIVISAGTGTTLDASTRDVVVAFEAEGPPNRTTVGWSVHVNGTARHVVNERELARLSALATWTLEHPLRLVAISTEHLSGRLAAGVEEHLDGALR